MPSPLASQSPPLQAQAQQIVSGVSGTWSGMAWTIDGERPLFSINASEALVPASNMKIFTSAWALDVLGPDHRFTTDLLLTGPVEDGILRGHVVLRGTGDPAFGYPDWERDSLDPLRTMARRLRELGVTAVAGDVIGDGTAFDSVLVGPDWPGDTGSGSAVYAPRVSGLPFQRNVVWIEAEPTSAGQPARIIVEPPVPEIPIRSDVRTGGNRAWAVREANNDTIKVRGSVSGNRLYRFGVGVADPALLAAGALKYALEEAGIRVGGRARTGPTPENARPAHRHYSVRLAEIIPRLNRESDNFFAEHLFKAAAHEVTGIGSYSTAGVASALHFIDRAGVEPGQLYQADGSGLSRYNRTSALSVVRVLVYANSRPWSDLFHSSLAVAAERGGTMQRMFRGGPAAANLHAKTGYIRRVRALSGYVTAANGELIAFSFIYNGGNTSGARGVEVQLGELLAGYSGR